MVRVYIRKTKRQSLSTENMKNAIIAVQSGMPIKTASRNFDVPRMTLKRRIKGNNKVALSDKKVLGSYKPVFTQDQEEELVNRIIEMERRCYGLTTKDMRCLAFQLAERNGIPHPFNRELGMAGDDWLHGFRSRHPELSLRVPEATSAARARAFNQPIVKKFFEMVQEVNSIQLYPPHRTFNVDETSIGTVSSRNSGVLAQKGRRQVGRIVSSERRESTTAVLCVSAGGTFIPPMLIFPRKRMKAELTDGTPPGTIFACNSSGWMRLEIFETWFQHFIHHAKPSGQDPALLFMDGHLSHTKNLNVIEAAREHSVTLICLPPHCTHKLQPLDVSVMFPLSTYYDSALEKWLNNHPGRVVTLFQISQIFGEAYLKACTPTNAINGFKKCGICPYDPDVFSEADFVAAETTDQAEEDADMEKAQKELNLAVSTVDKVLIEQRYINQQTVHRPTMPTRPTTAIHESQTECSSVGLHQPNQVLSSPETSGISSTHKTSFGSLSPAHIRPIPKIDGRRCVTRRKRGAAAVLTSSPYKNALIDEKRKRDDQQSKQTNRKNKKQNHSSVKKPGRPTKKKSPLNDSSDSNDENPQCLYCHDTFLRSVRGEGWLKCQVCNTWAHQECAGLDDEENEFICELCQI